MNNCFATWVKSASSSFTRLNASSKPVGMVGASVRPSGGSVNAMLVEG